MAAPRSSYSSSISISVTQPEVWPNAPLALVAMEARFPAASDAPLRPPVYRSLRDLLGSEWVIEGAKQQTVQVAFGTQVPPASAVRVEDLSRLTVRDRTRAVTVRAESLTVEATRYEGYASFRGLLERAFEAVERVMQPDGVTRLGLRYIDEIRVPGLTEPAEWDEWVDASLLAPRTDSLGARTWTGAVQYDTGIDRSLVLRYGPTDAPIVDPSGPLKRVRIPPPGPVFVLDFDSYWQPADIPAFTASELIVACDALRAPIRSLFDRLTSMRLVDEVFKKES
jgi:uncharacterized protein (TIGR04255 family)